MHLKTIRFARRGGCLPSELAERAGGRRRSPGKALVPKMSHAREQHRHAMFVGSGDDFFIPH